MGFWTRQARVLVRAVRCRRLVDRTPTSKPRLPDCGVWFLMIFDDQFESRHINWGPRGETDAKCNLAAPRGDGFGDSRQQISRIEILGISTIEQRLPLPRVKHIMPPPL